MVDFQSSAQAAFHRPETEESPMSDSSMGLPGPADAAIAEWYEAIDRGETPNREEFLARHQAVRSELERFLSDFARFTPARGAPAMDEGRQRDSRLSSIESPTLLDESREAASGVSAAETIRYFGDFQLIREIARGGMGVVYEARQLSLNRPVALKLILSGQLASTEEVARFHREAQAVAQLEHPGIVPIYEIGQHADQYYFAMAYVPGPSLAAKLLESPLEPKVAAALVRDCALAIQSAHDRGIVHRDLKPSNILLAPIADPPAGQFPYRPRITDFGLAKLGTSDSSMTQSGRILGTPSYMPPEQAAGHLREIGPASDLYALGAVLYASVTGRPPFQAASALDTVRQVIEQDPVSLRQLNSSVPADLETVCLKALEKSIPRRYQSARDFADDLDRFLDGRPILARAVTRRERFVRWCRRNPVVAGLSAGVLISLVAGILASSYFAYRERQRATHEAVAKADAVKQTGIATEALREQERLTRVAQASERAESQQRLAAVEAEKRATQAAESERKSAEELRHALYLSDMVRLPELAARHQASVIEQLLTRHVPEKGQTDRRGFDWYYWWNQIHAFDRVIRCPGPVRKLALSNDGHSLAIGLQQGVHVVDLEKGLVLPTAYPAADARLASLQFGKDGRTLLGSTEAGFPVAWELDSGQVLAAGLPVNLSQAQLATAERQVPRWSSLFSPDGRYFVGPDPLLELLSVWDLRQLLHRQLREPSDGVYLTNRLGDARTYSSRELFFENQQGEGWRRSSGFGGLPTAPPPSGDEALGAPTFALRFSPDGRWLACGGRGGQIQVFNLSDQRLAFQVSLGNGIVWDLDFSRDGKFFAAATDDGEAAVWSVSGGERISSYHGHQGAVKAIRFSTAGDLLFSAGADRDIHVWTRGDAQQVTRLLGHSDRVLSLVTSPNGRAVWSGADDGTIRRWPLTQLSNRINNDVQADLVGLSSSVDGTTVASLGSLYSDRIPGNPIWDGTTGRLRGQLAVDEWLASMPARLAVSPDGRLILMSIRQDVRVFDALTLTELSRSPMKVETAQDNPSSRQKASLDAIGADCVFTQDSRSLIVVARSGLAEQRNAKTGARERRFQLSSTGEPTEIRFSTDSKRLLCVTAKEVMSSRWPELDDIKKADVSGNTDLRCARSSPDGRYACVLSLGSKTHPAQSFLVDFNHSETVTPVPLSSPDVPIADAFFPRYGDCFLTVEGDTLCTRSLSSAEILSRAELPLGKVGALECTGIGRGQSDDHVLLPGSSGTILQWNWREKRTASEFEPMRRPIEAVSWSADGRRLIGYWQDGQLYAKSAEGLAARSWELNGSRSERLPPMTDFKLAGRATAPWPATPDDPRLRFDQSTLRDLARRDEPSWLAGGDSMRVSSLRISPDGFYAAVLHDGRRITVWKRAALDRPPRFHAIKIVSLPALTMAWSPGPEPKCAVGLTDALIVLTRSGATQFRIGIVGGARSVSWSRDGMTIATSSIDGRIDLWNASTGQNMRSFKALVGPAVEVLFPDDGVTLIAAAQDGQIFILDRQTGALRLKLGEHPTLCGLSLSPDSQSLASCGMDGVIQTWHAPRQPVTTDHPELELRANQTPLAPVDRRLAGWATVAARFETSESQTLSAEERFEVDLARRMVELGLPFGYRMTFDNSRRKYDPGAKSETPPALPPERGFVIDEVPLTLAVLRDGTAKYQPAMSSLKPADLAKLPRLRALFACGADWSAADLANIRQRPNLEELDLSGVNLKGVSADALQGLDRVQTLSLAEAKFDEEFLRRLSQLPALRTLTLSRTTVTDEGLSALSNLAELQALNLPGTSITDRGLASLGELPRLKWIALTGTRATVEGYKGMLARWPDLRLAVVPPEWTAERPELREALRATVEVDGSPGPRLAAIRQLQEGGHITAWRGTTAQLVEDDFAMLRHLPALREIEVSGAIAPALTARLAAAAASLNTLLLNDGQLTDDALAPLSKLSGLRRLHLSGSLVTPAGLRAIRNLPLSALRIENTKSVTMGSIIECFPKLRELSVKGCSLVDGDMAQLTALKHMEILDVSTNRPGQLTKAAVLGLPRLRWLSGSIYDARLAPLKMRGDMPRFDALKAPSTVHDP
ncbi:hypothetical protein AYO47_06130 [Planctomyces sp. SCGC AG-212-M04]|nr:hypothetical protein AYO47_06130 [Planctomyces sp. SCGC AG-212-M04]